MADKKRLVVGCTRNTVNNYMIACIVLTIIGLILGTTCVVVYEDKIVQCRDSIMDTTATIIESTATVNPNQRKLKIDYKLFNIGTITVNMIISCNLNADCATIFQNQYNVGNTFKIYFKTDNPSKPYQFEPKCKSDYVWLKTLYVLGFSIMTIGVISIIISIILLNTNCCILPREIITIHYELDDGTLCAPPEIPDDDTIRVVHRYV